MARAISWISFRVNLPSPSMSYSCQVSSRFTERRQKGKKKYTAYKWHMFRCKHCEKTFENTSRRQFPAQYINNVAKKEMNGDEKKVCM